MGKPVTVPANQGDKYRKLSGKSPQQPYKPPKRRKRK